MNTIREWAILLCSASVGSAFIIFLIPEGNTKKTANVVVALFLLSVVVMPLCGDDISFDFPEFDIDDLPEDEDYLMNYNEFIADAGEDVIRNQITAVLRNICKDDFDIDVLISNETDGNISIDEIHIYVSEEDFVFQSIIKSQIGSLSGVVPQVVIGN